MTKQNKTVSDLYGQQLHKFKRLDNHRLLPGVEWLPESLKFGWTVMRFDFSKLAFPPSVSVSLKRSSFLFSRWLLIFGFSQGGDGEVVVVIRVTYPHGVHVLVGD